METKLVFEKGWTLRIRRPPGDGPHPVVLLLHGWMGDEDAMWVFAGRIPDHFLIAAPRAPFAASKGYSWVERRSGEFSTLDDLRPAVARLEDFISSPPNLLRGDFSRVHLMGFSQGAAAAYSWAGLHLQRVASIAGLAGFVPDGVAGQSASFVGLRLFIAHGSRDRVVPIERMRADAEDLEQAGALVTWCEDDVGHKLSMNCGRAMEAFYTTLI